MFSEFDINSLYNDCESCEKHTCEGCKVLDNAVTNVKKSFNTVLGDANIIMHIISSGFEKNRQLEKSKSELDKTKSELNLSKTKSEQLEKCAFIDKLTGIGNRHEHDGYLDHVLSEINRKGESERYYLFLDIDKFKPVNDTFGHGIGDAILRYFAQTLKKEIRESDKVFRLGGDEFTIISFNNDNKGIKQFIDKLHNTIKENPYTDISGKKYPITFSAGICKINPGDTPEKVQKCADIALYCLKHDGDCSNCYIEGIYCLKNKKEVVD